MKEKKRLLSCLKLNQKYNYGKANVEIPSLFLGFKTLILTTFSTYSITL